MKPGMVLPEIKDLSKNFGITVALDKVYFAVKRGEIQGALHYKIWYPGEHFDHGLKSAVCPQSNRLCGQTLYKRQGQKRWSLRF
jgi:hypothetical protein